MTFLGLLRLLRMGVAWPHWAVLGIPVGAGLLTKQSALMLLPLGALGALVSAWVQRPIRFEAGAALKGIGRAMAFGVTALLLGGGWYLANAIRHGDPLGTLPHWAIQVPLDRFGWQALLAGFQSYWVAFGWALITAPWWLYAAVAVLVCTAIAGMLRAFVPLGQGSGCFWAESLFARRALAILVIAIGMNFVAFTFWAQKTGSSYGRLLFPTAAPVGVLLAWGLSQWRSVWYRRTLAGAVGVGCIAAVLLPWFLLRPAFRSPYRPNGMPATATVVVDGQVGSVSLTGYSVGESFISPGDRFTADLFWYADTAPDGLLTVSAQLRGLDATERIADDTRWLGGTLYPSSVWRPGDVVMHPVDLAVPVWASAPALVWLDVRVLDETGALLTFDQTLGDALSLGPWRIRGDVDVPATAARVGATLDAAIRLAAYEVHREGELLYVDLYWRAEDVPDADYTVFVHWLDAAGELIAQHDSPPAGGAYPTSWWLPGDVVPDRHALALDADLGGGTFVVGMYDPATGARLAAYGGDGARLPDDAIVLPWPQ